MKHPRTWVCLFALAFFCQAGLAQPTTPPIVGTPVASSLGEALESAWQRHPWQQSQANRRAEITGRKLQTNRFLSALPTFGLAHTTDRIGSNNGLRGIEAELSAPLWNANLRAATMSQIERDEQRFELAGQAAKLKLAGELRELAARYALAQADENLAKRRAAEASVLSGDVARRVKAGDVARVDTLMAQSAEALTRTQLETAQAERLAIQNQWLAATGLSTAPSLLASALTGTPASSQLTQTPQLQSHPQWLEAQATSAAMQAKLATTLADSRDPVEVGLSAMREKSARGNPNETSMKFSVRVPFGGASRNDAKAAAARAELDEAQNAFFATERQLQAEQTTALAQLTAAQRSLGFAEQRAKLAAEAQSLYAKAYRLGESDLVTRLRADNEKFDADLALSRAQLQLQRAQSHLQHSQGLLP